MRVIPKKEITDTILLSCSVPESDHPEWSSANDYSAGDFCIVLAVHKIYKCLVTHTSTNYAYPPDDITSDVPKWADYGSTNRWKMFDDYLNTQTTQDTSIEFVLDATACDSVALFNVYGLTVDWQLLDDGDNVLNSGEIDLLANAYNDWADIFFTEPDVRSQVYFPIPISFGTKIAINVTGSTVAIGKVVIGKGQFIGKTKYGLQYGTKDYSKKSTSELGETYLKQGNFADTAEFDLWVDNNRRPFVKQTLTSIRATGCAWILDNNDENPDTDMIVYGFCDDWSVVVDLLSVCGLNVSLQGLI